MPRPVSSTPASPRRALAVVATALALSAAPALAAPTDSTSADAPATAPTTARRAGPTLDGRAVAARPRTDRQDTNADRLAAMQQQQRRHHGPAIAMMVVGASGIVLGILVGGDAQAPLIVGGAIVGGIGLYRYLL
jgi:hypothetical protein